MTEYTLTIQGRLPSLNEYIEADRRNKYKGSSFKKRYQTIVELVIRSQLHGVHITRPVFIHYEFYEPNKKRDHDNVSAFAHKVIQDALVQQQVIADDGWDEVTGYSDHFFLDRKEPHITVTIQEGD